MLPYLGCLAAACITLHTDDITLCQGFLQAFPAGVMVHSFVVVRLKILGDAGGCMLAIYSMVPAMPFQTEHEAQMHWGGLAGINLN
jgi:hypothetical protein